MKNILSLIFFAVAATAFGQCNTGTLKGAYSMSVVGVGSGESGAITVQYLGRVDFDGTGKFTLKGITTLNNTSTPDDDSGTYEVSAECALTGKATGSNADLNGVVSNSGSDHMILVRLPSVTLVGGGSSIDGLGSCTAASLNGAFAYSGQGPARVNDLPATFGEVGGMTFDGKGGVTGNFFASVTTTTSRDQFAGTYELAANCVGKARLKIAGVDVVLDIVPTANGNGFAYQNVGPNGVITGAGSKLTR